MSENQKMNPKMEQVWNNLVEKVEQDPGIWEKPWFKVENGQGYLPKNFATGRNYSGFNIVMLEITRLTGGYRFNQWVAFNQAKKMGGFVKKGEKGTPIIVFSPPKYETVKNPETGESEDKEVKPAFFTSSYVWNIEQPTLDLPEEEEPKRPMEITEIEAIIQATGANIVHLAQDRAYYSPSMDKIVLPLQEQFKGIGHYYETKFHELIHWTGHQDRLNRLSKTASFGTDEYSREELVAEIGAVFLKNHTGIADTLDNAAAYIKNWWQVIKEDKGSLIDAAAKAQRATDFILSGGAN